MANLHAGSTCATAAHGVDGPIVILSEQRRDRNCEDAVAPPDRDVDDDTEIVPQPGPAFRGALEVDGRVHALFLDPEGRDLEEAGRIDAPNAPRSGGPPQPSMRTGAPTLI